MFVSSREHRYIETIVGRPVELFAEPDYFSAARPARHNGYKLFIGGNIQPFAQFALIVYGVEFRVDGYARAENYFALVPFFTSIFLTRSSETKYPSSEVSL